MEIELKFAVAPQDVARLVTHRRLASVHPTVEPLTSTYFDTADGLLRGASMSLRLRTSGRRTIQTLKRDPNRSNGLFVREEYEDEVVGAEPELDLIRSHIPAVLLKSLRGSLKPIFRIDVRRTHWHVAAKDCFLDVALDEGWIRSDSGSAPLREFEIECGEGDLGAMFKMAREMADVLPLRLEVRSKADRGYRLVQGETGVAEKAEPVELSPDLTPAAAFRRIASLCIRHFAINAAAFIEQPAPEALHQMRVAIRRFRSLLSLDRHRLSKRRRARLRLETGYALKRLGKARNLDVLVTALQHGDIPGRYPKETVSATLGKRETAYAKVLAMLQSRKFCGRMLDLLVFVESGSWKRSGAGGGHRRRAQSLKASAAATLQRQWRKLLAFDKISRLDAEERHRLRLNGKEFRYACEFFGSVFASDRRKGRRDDLLRAAEDFQDVLGRLTDLTSMNKLLRWQPAPNDLPSGAAKRRDEPPLEMVLLQAAEKAQEHLRAQKPFWTRH